MEKQSEESSLALGRGLDLCLDLDLLCRLFFSPITERCRLYFVFHSASDQLHDPSQLYFQTSGPRAEQVPSSGGLASSLFRKITQQYILHLEYAISANFPLFETMSHGFWRELHAGNKATVEPCLPCPMFLLSFYNNIKVQVSGVISCISGGHQFS